MNKTKLHFYIKVNYGLMFYINMPLPFFNDATKHNFHDHIDAEFHPGPSLGNPEKWVLHIYFDDRDFIKY